jgi:hypothetical protein
MRADAENTGSLLDRGEPASRFALGARRLRPVVPVLIIGALLALVPFSTCVVRLAVDLPCPACGLTRSMLALARLDVAASLRWHPLGLALLALAAVVSASAFIAGDAPWRRLVRFALNTASVGLLLVWALRFAGLFGGPVP